MAIGPDIQDEHAPELSITDARQGLRGRHAAWILGISMALIVVGFTSLWLVNAPRNAAVPQPAASSKTLQQSGFQAPPSQPRQSENPQTRPSTPGIGSDGRGL